MAMAAFAATAPRVDRDQIILENLPLVKILAANLHQRLPANVDIDDLIQTGILGLLAAIDKYRPDRNVPFALFARHRIRGAMLDSLRQLDTASRKLRQRQKDTAEAARELEATLNCAPTGAEIAAKLGMAIESWHKMMLEFRNSETVSASTISEENGSAMDFPCKPAMHPDMLYGRAEMCAALHGALDQIAGRYRAVLTLHYEEHLTLRQIGLKLGVHESRIAQLHKVALTKLRAVLAANGIQSAAAF